jgi:hypothetical protein
VDHDATNLFSRHRRALLSDSSASRRSPPSWMAAHYRRRNRTNLDQLDRARYCSVSCLSRFPVGEEMTYCASRTAPPETVNPRLFLSRKRSLPSPKTVHFPASSPGGARKWPEPRLFTMGGVSWIICNLITWFSFELPVSLTRFPAPGCRARTWACRHPFDTVNARPRRQRLTIEKKTLENGIRIAEASRGERYLEVNYGLAARSRRHSR